MGFWNALSVLAPVAPAMSDAQDIRTARQQDAAKFTQDSELHDAQMTAQKMAAQEAQQRIFKDSIVRDLGWNPTTLSDQVLIQDPNSGAFRAQDTPGGVNPSERYQQLVTEAEKTTGRKATPEEKENWLLQSYGMKPQATLAYRPLPGVAGQPQERIGPDGKKTYVRDVLDPTTNQIVEQPMPAGYTPFVKTPQNDTRFITITGRPESTWSQDDQEFVKGYKNMVDTKMTQPGVARMNALAQSRIVTPIDPNDQTSEIYSTAGQAMRQGLHAPGSIDYRMQMPTGQERGRADLALSAREQISDLAEILRRRSDLFGTVSGRATNMQVWLGSQDPDAQRVQAAARVISDHLTGVFGARSQYSQESILAVVGKNATNPAAAIAGLEQLDKAAAKIESRGIGPNAAGSGTGGANGGSAKHKIGDKHTFPNGNEGAWDGVGWRVTKLAKAAQ